MGSKVLRIKSFAFEMPMFDRACCDFCGREYENFGIAIAFNGRCGVIWLEGIWLCGDCLLSGPEAVSERMIGYASRLRTDPLTRKRAKKKGAEFADSLADEIEEFAPLIRKLGDFSLILGYEMAVAVATVQEKHRRVA
jgi:hypothetical protein